MTLPTGRTFRLTQVEYDNTTGTFNYAGLNVTPYLTPGDKIQFPCYDPTKDNAALSDARILSQGGTPQPVGSTSTVVNMAQGVGADVAGIAGGIRSLFDSPWKVLGWGLLIWGLNEVFVSDRRRF
ncbi:MAG: hypothetical protein AB1705_21540 [Verrucomicrobiota bacterium]